MQLSEVIVSNEDDGKQANCHNINNLNTVESLQNTTDHTSLNFDMLL